MDREHGAREAWRSSASGLRASGVAFDAAFARER